MLIVRIQLPVITAFIASTNVLARGWGQEFWGLVARTGFKVSPAGSVYPQYIR